MLTVDEAKIDCKWAIKTIAIILRYSKIDYLAEELCWKIHETHDEWLVLGNLVEILIKTKVRQQRRHSLMECALSNLRAEIIIERK